MALSEQFIEDETHPIDIVETLAEHHNWDFDRIADDQLAMAVVGQGRTYSITLAWSDFDETLRMVCTFEMDPPAEKIQALYHALNLINDECWSGTFTWWNTQKLMVFRYGLVQSGSQVASAKQIDTIIGAAVQNAERYYPAFQLVAYGDQTPEQALQVAIAEAYGRA